MAKLTSEQKIVKLNDQVSGLKHKLKHTVGVSREQKQALKAAERAAKALTKENAKLKKLVGGNTASAPSPLKSSPTSSQKISA